MKKRIFTLIICFALAFVIGGEMLLHAFSIKASAETVSSYDDTRIEDDISHLDFTNYPRNESGDPGVVYFAEYCYSVNSDVSDKYGLYIYVYNPTEKVISVDSGRNKVEIAVEYNDNGEATRFEKLSLNYLDKTDNNRFYKFKITDSKGLLTTAQKYASANDGVRRYVVIGVELTYGTSIKDNSVSKVYEFSGYGAYCDKDKTPMSSLVCKDYGARSIYLELDHTNYRFDKRDSGGGVGNYKNEGTLCDELNSVYFSVPESYFNDFGNLTEISAEWYEYKTKYMFVTSDDGAFAGLRDLRNIRINEFGQAIDYNGNVLDNKTLSYWRVLWDEKAVGEYGSDGLLDKVLLGFGESYNPKCRDDIDDDTFWDQGLFGDASGSYTLGGYQGNSDSWTYSNYLNWLFLRQGVNDSDDYRVSRDEVESYMKEYTKIFPDDALILGKYASSLFETSIDSDRIAFLENKGATSGYIRMDFNATNFFDENVGNQFEIADADQSKWNKFWFGTNYETVTYSPIVTLSAGDLDLSDDAFSEKFYVGKEDVKRIKENARKDLNNNKVPVLLRFAVTDYYASTARFDYAEEDAFEMSGHDGYVAQETLFLDFDVISLTFTDPDGFKDVVIGVVSDPIDIINGLTPPSDLEVDEQSWFKKIVALIVIFIVVVAFHEPLGKLLHYVFDGFVALISFIVRLLLLPFNLIGKLFSGRRRW